MLKYANFFRIFFGHYSTFAQTYSQTATKYVARSGFSNNMLHPYGSSNPESSFGLWLALAGLCCALRFFLSGRRSCDEAGISWADPKEVG